jgi:hypothetical protein
MQNESGKVNSNLGRQTSAYTGLHTLNRINMYERAQTVVSFPKLIKFYPKLRRNEQVMSAYVFDFDGFKIWHSISNSILNHYL